MSIGISVVLSVFPSRIDGGTEKDHEKRRKVIVIGWAANSLLKAIRYRYSHRFPALAIGDSCLSDV